MQALNASNAVPSEPYISRKDAKAQRKFSLSRSAFRLGTFVGEKFCRGNLPMIDQKKTSELIETSLVYLLSAAVAVGAFVLVWLISLLLGPSQT